MAVGLPVGFALGGAEGVTDGSTLGQAEGNFISDGFVLASLASLSFSSSPLATLLLASVPH